RQVHVELLNFTATHTRDTTMLAIYFRRCDGCGCDDDAPIYVGASSVTGRTRVGTKLGRGRVQVRRLRTAVIGRMQLSWWFEQRPAQILQQSAAGRGHRHAPPAGRGPVEH